MLGLLAGLLVSSWFAVEGASTCPTPAQVSDALSAVTEPGATADGATAEATRFTVRVEENAAGLVLELRHASGARVGLRQFPPGGACEEKARASALVVAFWLRELRGPAVSEDQPSTPPAAVLTTSVAPPDRPTPAPSGAQLEVAAAFSAAVTGSTGAYGGALEALLTPRARGLGARLAAVGLSAHEVNVGPGVGRWERLAVTPALNYRWVAGLWLVDVHVDALLAAVRLEGQGLDVTRSTWRFDPGVGAGLRAARVPRPGSWFAPYAAVQMWAWPSRHTLLVAGSSDHGADLPRIEGLFQLGLAVGRY
jgi:hypothetical protein